MGLTHCLTVVFVVLKLIGTIDWSWWLVLLPEIIVAVVYVIFVIYGAVLERQAHRSLERLFEK